VLKDEVVKLADPVESRVTDTDWVPLSEKITVPVGMPEVDGVTVAVNVTDCPGADGSGDEFIAVFVDAVPTLWAIGAEVLATKFASPW
jgi:hypothetical protein